MIKSIELENFQGHKYSFLELHPGVNVIKGPSHKGKSSIMRAFRWVILNKPLGGSFKSWFSTKKEPTGVLLELDKGAVLKQRKREKNSYTYGEETLDYTLEAMRAEVPDEVRNILQLEDINIQTQHEGYFLLQSSPGIVGKKLNAVAGLDVIDRTLKRVNTKANKLAKDAEYCKVELETIQSKLESFAFLDSVTILLGEVKGIYDDLGVFEHQMAELKVAIFTIDNETETIRVCSEKIKFEPLIGELGILWDEKAKLGFRHDVIEDVSATIIIQQSLVTKCSGILELEELARTVEVYGKQNNLDVTRLREIANLVGSIESELFRIAEGGKKQHAKEVEYEEGMKKLKICPFCGQKITKVVV